MLAGIVVCGAVTLVLGFLDGCLLVALIQVGDNVSVQVLNFLFERGKCLNPSYKIRAQLGIQNLRTFEVLALSFIKFRKERQCDRQK